MTDSEEEPTDCAVCHKRPHVRSVKYWDDEVGWMEEAKVCKSSKCAGHVRNARPKYHYSTNTAATYAKNIYAARAPASYTAQHRASDVCASNAFAPKSAHGCAKNKILLHNKIKPPL